MPYSTDVEDFNELLTERDGNGNHKNHVSGKLHGENGVHEKICGPNMVILLIGHVQDGLRRFVESLPSIMRNNPIPHLVPEGRREPDASSESGESTEQDTLPEPDAGFESDEPWEAETHDTNNENVEALEALREKQERESPNHHRRLVVASKITKYISLSIVSVRNINSASIFNLSINP